MKYYAHAGELYSIINQAHTITGHGGVHKISEVLNRRYVNISRPIILLFLRFCETFQKKEVFRKKVS